ncbi:MAG: indolepyruvate ferredoxin oxidoreductase subunit alpha [Methylocystaceae bacterium]
MLGNEAIAAGAFDAGVKVGAAYPGTPSTEIMENFSRYTEVYAEWAPNEKVAMEVGCGASIAGARTLVAMKHVGVNVAADPLFTFAYTGVNGGLVIISADDPGMHSSQNEQDNRGYGIFAKLPVIEPSDSQEAYDYIRMAYDLSETFDTPVMFRITTRLAHAQGLVNSSEPKEPVLKDYKKDPAKFVMLPGFARARHLEVEKRMTALRQFAESTPLNRIEWGDRKIGIVTSGAAYQYVREVMPEASVLKLGLTNPLPVDMIKEFAAGVERLVVVEELEPVIEQHIKAIGIKVQGKDIFPITGEFTPELVAKVLLGIDAVTAYPLDNPVTPRPPLLCPGCPHRGVFHTLKKKRLVVAGDIGCYTLGAMKPLGAMDSCICMGASIGTAMGMEKARGAEYARKVVAVIGDSTFVHSGITGLVDMVYNRSHGTVMILDNSTTAMTGHQEHPGTGRTITKEETNRLDLIGLITAIGVKHIQVVNPLDLKALEAAIDAAVNHNDVSVIIAKHPCALLSKHKASRMMVDQELCNGCKTCIRVGCTGIAWDEELKKAYVKPSLCIECGLCPQVCKQDAIAVKEG